MTLCTKKNGRVLWQRLTAGVTLFLFLTTQNFSSGLPSLAQASEIQVAPHKNLLDGSIDKIKVPESFGHVEESFQGGSGKTVVVVQDAHSIPDAQKSIQRIIQYFQSEYGVATIGLEGASSQLDAEIFRSFPDKARLKKVFKEYMLKGELSGGTAAAIFSDNPTAIFQGVEDWELYEQGVRLYQGAMGGGEVVRGKVKGEREKVEKEKKAIYSRTLLEIDHELMHFNQARGDLSVVLKKLAAVKRPELGTELAALLEETEREGTDQSAVEAEVRGIAEEIRGLWIVNSGLSLSLSLPVNAI